MRKIKRVSIVFLAITLMLNTMIVSAFDLGNSLSDVAFIDVTEDNPNYNEITELENRKYIIGIAQDIYAPDDNTTRAEFLKMLLFAVNKNEDSEYKNILSDVPEEHWASHYIMRALELGIFECGELVNYEFNPDDYIDKETAALWITRAMGSFIETELTVEDKDEIVEAEAVASVLDMGVMTASDNKFYPRKNFIRSDAAYIVKQVMDKYDELKFVNEDKDEYTYKEDLVRVTASSNTNNIIENNDEYITIENIDTAVRNLSVGNVFFVAPCSELPSGLAVKVKSINISADNAVIYKDDIQIEDVFSYIDISKSMTATSQSITLEDGFEFIEDEAISQVQAVDSLPNDEKINPKAANYIIGSKVPIKVNKKLSDNFEISGTIALGLSIDAEAKWKWDKFADGPSVLLKANSDLSLDFTVKASLNNSNTKDIKFGSISMPIGSSGLFATGDLYLSVDANGSYGVKFEQKNSVGFEFKKWKTRTIYEKSGSGLTPVAEGKGSIYRAQNRIIR